MEEKDINFEKNMARLQEIVESLKDGTLSLDESLSVFEEGVKLTKMLEKKLKEVEDKVLEIYQEEKTN